MYIFKNALISIIRNRGRNLLIGIIIVVISCATSITLAIRNSASSLIKSYENQYEVEATIGINRESMRGKMKIDKNASPENQEEQKNNMNSIFTTASNLSIAQINDYGNSEYVKDYYYQISVSVNSNNIEQASIAENTNISGRGPSGKQNFQNISSGDFTLVGYSKLSAMENFINGKYSIIDGEISSDMESKNCVINSELATLNGINVGDTITFIDASDETNTITLKVTGIYEEKTEEEDSMGMFTTSANTIITNSSVVEEFSNNNESIKKSITPTFILNSKDVIEKFSEELTDKGLNEYLTVTTNLDEVENATKTISNVLTFATTFLVITLIIGGIVLFVINMINIRERKYEIGVLRTIGMKKSLLSLQFMSELLIVSFISLLIGASIGAVTSVPISNHLLENEIANSQEQKQNISSNFGSEKGFNNFDKISGVTEVEAFDSIDAAVDLKVLLQLFVIGILLTLISSSASMISIQKFSPLTILKERS